MKQLTILVFAIVMVSCGTETKKEEMHESFKVEYKGALKNMMHKGDLSAKADLKDLEETEHLYALGAAENLKGEIQIFDGKSFNTMVEDSALVFDKTFEKKAALLVYASVTNWTSIPVPSEVVTYEQLEKFIGSVAEEHHIDIHAPFPFLIEGTPESYDWHVINWKDGDTEHSHEKHVNSGLHGTLKDKEVEMLGFYSDAHHRIFTHHSTNMHIHVRALDGSMAGHVDGLTLGKGMLLKLPEVKE